MIFNSVIMLMAYFSTPELPCEFYDVIDMLDACSDEDLLYFRYNEIVSDHWTVLQDERARCASEETCVYCLYGYYKHVYDAA